MLKKGIMLKFLVWTILAILLFVATTAFLTKFFFRLSDQGMKSYNSMYNMIASSKDWNDDMNSLSIAIDEDTAIIGYSSGNDPFMFTTYVTLSETVLFSSKKPDSCSEDKACLCIFREGLDIGSDGEITASSSFCKDIENIDFINEVHPSYNSNEDLSQELFKNGFLIVRSKKFNDYFLSKHLNIDDRLRVIYVEKYNGKIAVCEKYPSCIQEDIKNNTELFQGGSPGLPSGASGDY